MCVSWGWVTVGILFFVSFGDQTDLVVMCGRCPVSSGEEVLIGCVSRIDGMLL